VKLPPREELILGSAPGVALGMHASSEQEITFVGTVYCTVFIPILTLGQMEIRLRVPLCEECGHNPGEMGNEVQG